MKLGRQIETRPYRDSDFDKVYGIIKQAGRGPVEELSGAWPEPHQTEFFRDRLNGETTTVMSHRGRIIGTYQIAESDEKLELKTLFVDPDYQSKGIGAQVLEITRKAAHDAAKPLELDVLTSNRDAIRFYERNGFEMIGETRGPEGSGFEWVNEYQMRDSTTAQYAPRPPATGDGPDAAPPRQSKRP